MSHSFTEADGKGPTGERSFKTTHWSDILAIGHVDSPASSRALERLCAAYWPPLYGFARRRGAGPEDAKDLTQSFFVCLLEKNFWSRADQERGRFRSFLLKAFTQFLADEWDKSRAAKRGGRARFISIDEESGEDQYLAVYDPGVTAEQQYDRQWAHRVLDRANAKLRRECMAAGRLELYERACLQASRDEKSIPYADLGREQGMSVSAIKAAVRRLRLRYGELLREEIAQTIRTPTASAIDNEFRSLMATFVS